MGDAGSREIGNCRSPHPASRILPLNMKAIRAVAVLPTLFTLGNLVCGFFAIVVLARIEKPDATQPPSPRIELNVDSPKELGEKAREFIESEDPTHNLMLAGALIL